MAEDQTITRLKEMIAALQTFYRGVRDESPTWPAWEHSNYDGPRIEWPPYWKPATPKQGPLK